MCCKPKLLHPLVVQTFLVITTPTKKNKIQEKNIQKRSKQEQIESLNPSQKQLAYLIHISNFVNDAEGLNPSSFRICGTKSVAREDKAANAISFLPTVQDRGAQPASHAK
jgi:hypothetical protein